jgi:hypothetical protein
MLIPTAIRRHRATAVVGLRLAHGCGRASSAVLTHDTGKSTTARSIGMMTQQIGT